MRAQNNYDELRYALRSLCSHYPETELILIGPQVPAWIKNVQHINFPDATFHEWKAKNIFDKTLAAFKHTERLLFMNDDHILLSPVNYSHHKGPLIDNIKGRNPIATYTVTLQNTYDVFGEVNDFDTHCPIWYDREAFNKLVELDWTKAHGYGIKTSYCAANGIEGEYYPDLKFMDKVGDYTGRLYFTVDDNCQLLGLKNLFPEKCIFEL